MNQWIEIDCPFCNKTNFVSNGDTNDLTVSDVEAVNCWKCKKKFPIAYDGMGEDLEVLCESVDDLYDVDGIKSLPERKVRNASRKQT